MLAQRASGACCGPRSSKRAELVVERGVARCRIRTCSSFGVPEHCRGPSRASSVAASCGPLSQRPRRGRSAVFRRVVQASSRESSGAEASTSGGPDTETQHPPGLAKEQNDSKQQSDGSKKPPKRCATHRCDGQTVADNGALGSSGCAQHFRGSLSPVLRPDRTPRSHQVRHSACNMGAAAPWGVIRARFCHGVRVLLSSFGRHQSQSCQAPVRRSARP